MSSTFPPLFLAKPSVPTFYTCENPRLQLRGALLSPLDNFSISLGTKTKKEKNKKLDVYTAAMITTQALILPARSSTGTH
jgi:hypothetical protein